MLPDIAHLKLPLTFFLAFESIGFQKLEAPFSILICITFEQILKLLSNFYHIKLDILYICRKLNYVTQEKRYQTIHY